MSEDLEEILEDIKMYAGIVFGMLLILDIILVASMYQEYGTVFGYNTAMNNVILVLLIATIVLFVVFIVLGVYLRIQQGDMYISIGDIWDTVVIMLFPTDAKSKKEICQILDSLGNRSEIKSTALWKKITKGINVYNLLKSVCLFTFGSAVLYVVIKSWIKMDDERIVMTVMGALFILILYFWCIVCAMGVKKRPDYVLDYLVDNELKFDVLNRDFSQAIKCGSKIYKGAEYIFIGIGKGMQVVAIEDVIECNIIRMAGWNPRRLFLPYYVLDVSTEGEHIIKYGMNPIAFYKLKDAIERVHIN